MYTQQYSRSLYPLKWNLLRLWWKQLPIWYRIVENEEQLILRRAVSNIVLYLAMKVIFTAINILLFINFQDLWPVWLIIQTIIILRTVLLIRYKLTFDKQKHIVYIREFKTNRYFLDGAFYLQASTSNQNITGRYDKEWLFVLYYETPAYEKVTAFLRSIDVPFVR